MLLFRSEEDVAAWCVATGEPHGESLPLDQVWELSRAWYGDRMDPDFRGRTTDEVMKIFANVGLTSAFWHAG
ncbi:MAG: hypothetical protein ACTHNK_14720 [Thermomicrobiales bacterium]